MLPIDTVKPFYQFLKGHLKIIAYLPVSANRQNKEHSQSVLKLKMWRNFNALPTFEVRLLIKEISTSSELDLFSGQDYLSRTNLSLQNDAECH